MVSGGRPGADRAALDWAMSRGLEHRGWCPADRRSDDGPIPQCYHLRETESANQIEPTEFNVRDSDATVVFSLRKEPESSIMRAVHFADALHKPWLRLHHGTPYDPPSRLSSFLRMHHVAALHVTGSRAEHEPGIADFVKAVLDRAWSQITQGLMVGGAESPGRAGISPAEARPAPKEAPVLRTARLVLRPFSGSDAAAVQEYLADPTLGDATLQIPHPYPPDEAGRWIAGHGEALEEGVWHWAMTLADGHLVGGITLFVSPENSRGTVGYWVGRAHRGQGLASEALRRVICFGFAHLGLHRVEGAHLAVHADAGRVMDAAGMICEGVLHGHVLRDGRYHDVIVHGILNPLAGLESGSSLAANPGCR
jgi:RimJ/RimL family protein N-acetyltransferase